MAVKTPVGELSTLGVGKETTFNTLATLSVFHESEAFSPATKTSFIQRMGSVGAPGVRPPATGPLDISGSLRVAPVSDIGTQLMAYAFGSQSTPTRRAYVNTNVGTGGYTGGSTSLPVTAGSAVNVLAGMLAVIAGDANTPAVVSVAGNVVTLAAGGFASSHASGVAVSFVSPTGYTSNLSFGNLRQLPSFSMEYNVPTVGGFGECVDYTGCVIETMKLALASAKGLTIDYTFAGVNQVKQSSPTAASFSNKNIYTMEAGNTQVLLNGNLIGGLTSPPDVKSWDLTLSNALDKTRRSAGSGRYVNGFPLGQRKVSGTMKLGFESEAARLIFWGGATGPSAVIAGVPLEFIISSQDQIDVLSTNAPFSMAFYLNNVFMTQADVPHKMSGGLEQTVNFFGTESSVGAGDDLQATLVNEQSAIW